MNYGSSTPTPPPHLCVPPHLSTTLSYLPSCAVPGITALAMKRKHLPIGVKILTSFANSAWQTPACSPATGNTVPCVCSFQLVRTRKTLNSGLCGFLLRELNAGSPASGFTPVSSRMKAASSVGDRRLGTQHPHSQPGLQPQTDPPSGRAQRRLLFFFFFSPPQHTKVTASICIEKLVCLLFPADRETSCPSRVDTTHFAHPASPKLKINRYALKTLEYGSPAHTSPAPRRPHRRIFLSFKTPRIAAAGSSSAGRSPQPPPQPPTSGTGLWPWLFTADSAGPERAGTDTPGPGWGCSGPPPSARLANAPFRASALRRVPCKVAFSSPAASLGDEGGLKA